MALGGPADGKRRRFARHNTAARQAMNLSASGVVGALACLVIGQVSVHLNPAGAPAIAVGDAYSRHRDCVRCARTVPFAILQHFSPTR